MTLARSVIYDNARYDAGYRLGWRDAHRRTRPAHKRTREKYREYAKGYAHGFEGGTGHTCPEWDDAHRTGPLSELPEDCEWRYRE